MHIRLSFAPILRRNLRLIQPNIEENEFFVGVFGKLFVLNGCFCILVTALQVYVHVHPIGRHPQHTDVLYSVSFSINIWFFHFIIGIARVFFIFSFYYLVNIRVCWTNCSVF